MLALTLGGAAALAAESTIGQPINELRYNGDADYAYFVGAAGWGSPSCPAAEFVQIRSGVPGRRQLLVIALVARATGARVAFTGECDANPRYFNATNIIVN